METLKSRKRSTIFLYFVLYAIHIVPYSINYVVPMKNVQIAQIASTLVLGFIYFVMQKKIYYKTINLSLCILLFYLFLCTYLNGEKLKECSLLICTVISTYFYIDLGFRCDKELTLRYVSYYLIGIVATNAMIILFLGGSMFVGEDINNQWNFLGTDNYQGCIIVPALFVVLYYFESYRHLRLNQEMAICMLFAFALFARQSSTSIVAIVICCVLMSLLKRNQSFWDRIFRFKWLIVASIISFYLLTIAEANVFKLISVNVLGESDTFHGRTVFWKMALDAFAKSKWIGYGFTTNAFSMITHGYQNVNQTTPHSGYLSLLLFGGLPLFGIFFWMIFNASKRIDFLWMVKFQYRILSLGIIGILIILLAEWNVFRTPILWLVIIIFDFEGYYASKAERTARLQKY